MELSYSSVAETENINTGIIIPFTIVLFIIIGRSLFYLAKKKAMKKTHNLV